MSTNTELIKAIKDHFYGRVVDLVESGADVNYCDENYVCALEHAVKVNDLQITQYLAEDYRMKRAHYKSALHIALNYHNEAISDLLSKYVKSNFASFLTMENTFLIRAIGYGYTKTVKNLLENKLPISAQKNKGVHPLHYAALFGKKEIINLLVKHGVDVNEKDENERTALEQSARHGNISSMEALLENGAFINPTTYSPKMTFGDLLMMGIFLPLAPFLEEQRMITAPNKNVLYNAVLVNRPESIDLLLKYDKNLPINGSKQESETPLHLAIQNNNPQTVQKLIQLGADVNLCSQGIPPLYTALKNDYTEIAESLIKNKANLNFQFNGDTPLHIAVQNKNEKLILLLLEYGINQRLANKNGLTALDLARITEYKKGIEILSQPDLNSFTKKITSYKNPANNLNIDERQKE